MSDVMGLLKERQGEMSNESFANKIGLTGTTLWRYHNNKSDIDLDSRGKMLQYFAAQGDAEMVGALLTYKAVEVSLEPDTLKRLGNCFLDLTLALAPST